MVLGNARVWRSREFTNPRSIKHAVAPESRRAFAEKGWVVWTVWTRSLINVEFRVVKCTLRISLGGGCVFIILHFLGQLSTIRLRVPSCRSRQSPIRGARPP